jgi:DNA polymerase III alpha subunit
MKVVNIVQKTGLKLCEGSLPDIDSDFEGRRRGEVKRYIENRFGETQVASVGTFTTFRLRGLLKDFARLASVDFAEANLISSIIDFNDLTFLDLIKRAQLEPKLKQFIKQNSDFMYMLPSLLNQPKVKSIHPCAVIIFPDVMSSNEWVPTRVQQNMVVSEWSGEDMDNAGFLKEDILGIKQLDKFQDILDLIKSNNKEVPDIYNLPPEPEVYRYFSNGWNGDVFQFGTEGLSDYSKKLKPQTIDDLIAAVALYRPGPMDNHYHEIYVKCKNDGRKPTYLWGTESITKDTYGLLVYQEQIMQVFQQIGGLTMVEADDIRRAMGKLKLEDLLKWKDRAEKGFLERGCPIEAFNETWDSMVFFARYSFNKCLSGDEVIFQPGINGSVKSFTIKEMFGLKNNKPITTYSNSNKRIHDKFNRRGYGYSTSLTEDGTLVKNKIVDIYYQGKRDIYRMTLTNGATIDCTMNHKFPTSNGEKQLSQIDISSDRIYHTRDFGVQTTNQYKKKGIETELLKIKDIKFLKTDEVYDVEMEDPYHTFTVKSGIVTSNSHSTAYALTGYISQFLKVFFPIEFWTVALDYADEKATLNYLSEILQAKKISIKPPDVNKSEISMISEQESNSIFWGIGSIKGIGEDTASQIIEERKKNGSYTSLVDFIQRHTFTGSKVKKQTYEALISSGAFDILYGYEGKEHERLNLITEFREIKKVKPSNLATDPYTIGTLDEKWWWCKLQKSLTGLSIIDYREIAEEKGFDTKFCSQSEFIQRQDRDLFRTFGGYIVECRVGKSVKGKYARLTIENNYKQFKLMVWSEEFARFEKQLVGSEKSLIIFDGNIRFDETYSKSNQFTLSRESSLIVL